MKVNPWNDVNDVNDVRNDLGWIPTNPVCTLTRRSPKVCIGTHLIIIQPVFLFFFSKDFSTKSSSSSIRVHILVTLPKVPFDS